MAIGALLGAVGSGALNYIGWSVKESPNLHGMHALSEFDPDRMRLSDFDLGKCEKNDDPF